MSDGPLIVQSDKTLLLEVEADLAEECRRAIAPFAVVVPPLPSHRSPGMGSSITPSNGTLSSTNAISVPNEGVPVTKLRVPSIGSRTHMRELALVMPISSPRMP